jgi:D-alanyl-D-alanine carboxypeptidase/D-alanyl-D-alanine-endopeptidase (penicillin-binding protein 4)
MEELGQGLKTGKYLINICPKSCRPQERMARFTAELFRAQMKQVGIKGSGTYGRKLVPAQARFLYRHENSKRLDEILSLMLKYSSNFIANLVYLTVGAEQYGYPATWEKADLAVHNTLVETLGEKTVAQIVQVEGSGLSRKNTMTSRAMLKVLQVFAPHAHLLRKRRQVLVKTGTMKGIFNYAGYLKGGKPFVVMLNQRANTRSTVLDRLKLGRY